MGASDLELRVAWQRHLEPGAAPDRTSQPAFESLLARHRDAGRHHHDARHVQWVIRHVLELAAHHEVRDLGAVVAAAFFHDSIHDVARDDNEARSAQLAVDSLRDLGWSEERCEHVRAMILATEHRAGTPAADTDTAVLVAADLAVLAAEPSAYSDYVRRVRREYAHLDDDEWRSGRRAFVEAFLARPSIFPPHLGLDTWERRARANLAAELAMLR